MRWTSSTAASAAWRRSRRGRLAKRWGAWRTISWTGTSKQMSERLSHLDEQGRARMVDISAKPDTRRLAVAEGRVRMKPETVAAIRDASIQKGDVLTVAKVAGILAATRAAELIPMCHPLLLLDVQL